MYTYNCVNAKGNKVSNQFIIFTPKFTSLKSYNYIIVKTTFEDGQRVIYLDSYYWNYSKIIGKYRNLFLGENKKATQLKIKNNIYKLANLN
jgi:hypothetical protein